MQFLADVLYKLILAVPVFGGVLMVTVIGGADADTVLSRGLVNAAQSVFEQLSDVPVALACFLIGLGTVAAGAAVVIWLARAGTLPVLVAGERVAPDAHRTLMSSEGLRLAHTTSLASFMHGLERFGRRYVRVGAILLVAYALIGAAFAFVIVATYRLSDRGGWSAAWPFVALLVASASVVAIAVVNLLADLLQVVIACRDCGVRDALRSLRAFLLHDGRQVIGVFGVVLVLVILATLASLVIVAALGLVAFVPWVGVLVAVPLQLAAWCVRAGLSSCTSTSRPMRLMSRSIVISRKVSPASSAPASPSTSSAWVQPT